MLAIASLVLLAGALTVALSFLLRETVAVASTLPPGGTFPQAAAPPAELESLPAEESESSGRSAVEPEAAAHRVAGERNLLVRLWEGETRRPVEGARVSFLEQVVSSDASGIAYLTVPEDREQEGGWVQVEARGFFPECELWKGGEHEVEKSLWRKASFSVQARDAHSRLPLAGAKLRVVQQTDRAHGKLHAFANFEGKASFVVRSKVAFDLYVEAQGFLEHEERLMIAGTENWVVDLERQAMVEGVISFLDGTPAVGAQVDLWTDESEDEDSSGPHRVSSDEAGFDGRYRLEALGAGELLQLRAEDSLGRHAESELFTVDRANLREEVSLVLDWTGGQIVVRVVDAHGKPVPQVPVEATWWANGAPPEGYEPTGFQVDEWTDKEGTAVCNTPRTGPHLVCVSARQAPEGGFSFVREATTIHSARVVVDRGARVELEVRYPEVGRLTGLVLDAAGAPMDGAHVYFHTKRMDPWLGETSETSSAETDPDGRFLLYELPAIPGRLVLEGRAEVPWFQEIASITPNSQELVFRMPEPAEIRGHIEEVQAGTGLALILTINNRSFEHGVEARADGSFTVLTAVLGKAVRVEFVDEGGVTSFCREVELRAGQSCDLGDLRVERARHFHAMVVDERGTPVPEPEVAVWDASERIVYFVTGDVNGGIPLPMLPGRAGTIGIALEQDDIYRTFPCEDLSRLDGSVFVVHDLVHLEGQLSRVAGAWSGRAEVQAVGHTEDYDRNEKPETMSDRAGHFSLDLIPGRVQLFIRPFGALEWIAGPEILVPAGETTSLDWVVE